MFGLSLEATVLLGGGLVVLLLNIIYGLIRTMRGQVRGGWFTVAMALIACVMFTFGAINVASATAATNPSTTGRTGRFGSGAYNGGSGTPAVTVAALSTDTSDPSTDPQTFTTATAINTATPVAAENGTPAATVNGTPNATPNGTPGRRRSGGQGNGSGGGNGGSGARGTNGGGNGANGGNGARGTNGASGANGGNGANTNPANPAAAPNAPDASAAPLTAQSGKPNTTQPTTQADTLGIEIVLAGSVLCIIAALILYFMERRRTEFVANASRGLLDIGAGLFMGLAVLIIPIIPAQMAGAGQPSAARSARATSGAPVISNVITATPTTTPLPSATPTLLPTLTSTPTATLFATPTEIVYVNTQATNPTTSTTPTGTANGNLAKVSGGVSPAVTSSDTTCQVSATKNLNLRGDPSTANPLLLTIPAGTTLPVIGETKDKTWWKVTYNNGAKSTTGWVSAQFAPFIGRCSALSVLTS